MNGGVVNGVASFAEDGRGRLYMIDFFGGEIFQIRAFSVVPEPGSLLLGAFALGAAAAAGRKWRKSRRFGPA